MDAIYESRWKTMYHAEVFVCLLYTSLDDVEDALEMEFDEDDKDNFDTLNGFLISRLGHLPEDDEKGQVVFGGYRFSIVKAENKIIQTVTAERDAGLECEKENEG